MAQFQLAGQTTQADDTIGMKIAVVAYPRLRTTDRDWIEAFRAQHDPQSSKIRVHFTLVFPVEVIPSALATDIRTAATATDALTFAVRHAAVVRDALTGDHHIFLVPDQGAAELVALHDRLYAGTLAAHLRSDIQFAPHMTIGTASDRETAERFAEAAHVHHVVRGTVETLTLVDVGQTTVTTIATYDLGGGPPTKL